MKEKLVIRKIGKVNTLFLYAADLQQIDIHFCSICGKSETCDQKECNFSETEGSHFSCIADYQQHFKNWKMWKK